MTVEELAKILKRKKQDLRVKFYNSDIGDMDILFVETKEEKTYSRDGKIIEKEKIILIS